MTVLVAAVVLLGAIAILNLVLTLGLIRRLREHTERLNLLGTRSSAGSDDLRMAVGERPKEFEAATVDGRQVTTASMDGLELVGFFAHRCPPCKEWVPRFVQAAETMPGGRDRTLAIVAGSDADAAADPAGLVSQLGAVATVVTEDLDGPVAQAFGVHGYPTMYRLAPDGTISAADPHEVVAAPVAR